MTIISRPDHSPGKVKLNSVQSATPMATHSHFVKRELRLKTYIPLLMKGINLWSDSYKNEREQILELRRKDGEES